jgi:hypothetical protein
MQDDIERVRNDISDLRHEAATRRAELSDQMNFMQETIASIETVSTESAVSVGSIVFRLPVFAQSLKLCKIRSRHHRSIPHMISASSSSKSRLALVIWMLLLVGMT